MPGGEQTHPETPHGAPTTRPAPPVVPAEPAPPLETPNALDRFLALARSRMGLEPVAPQTPPAPQQPTVWTTGPLDVLTAYMQAAAQGSNVIDLRPPWEQADTAPPWLDMSLAHRINAGPDPSSITMPGGSPDDIHAALLAPFMHSSSPGSMGGLWRGPVYPWDQ